MTGVKELYPFLAALKVQCVRLQKAKCMTRVGEQMAQFDSVDMIIIYEEIQAPITSLLMQRCTSDT